MPWMQAGGEAEEGEEKVSESRALQKGYRWHPLRTYPRNAACPCGSGAKFKRCCSDKLPMAIPHEQAKRWDEFLAAVEDGRLLPAHFAAERQRREEERELRLAAQAQMGEGI